METAIPLRQLVSSKKLLESNQHLQPFAVIDMASNPYNPHIHPLECSFFLNFSWSSALLQHFGDFLLVFTFAFTGIINIPFIGFDGICFGITFGFALIFYLLITFVFAQ